MRPKRRKLRLGKCSRAVFTRSMNCTNHGFLNFSSSSVIGIWSIFCPLSLLGPLASYVLVTNGCLQPTWEYNLLFKLYWWSEEISLRDAHEKDLMIEIKAAHLIHIWSASRNTRSTCAFCWTAVVQDALRLAASSFLNATCLVARSS
jgi:hypothetical protein